jgi:hypothetical protein
MRLTICILLAAISNTALTAESAPETPIRGAVDQALFFQLDPTPHPLVAALRIDEQPGGPAAETGGRISRESITNLDRSFSYAAPESSATKPADEPPARIKDEGPGRFARKNWSVGAIGGAFQAINGESANIYFGGAIGEYFVIDNLSLRGELVGYSVDQHEFENSLGAGLNVLARWHPLKSKDSRLAMYLEGGAGLTEFDGRTPGPKGTDFEFSLHFAFGGTFQISDRISLIAGPRYMHFSNAGIHTEARHAGLDCVGGTLALSFKF